MADRIRVGIVGATVTPGGSGWGANAHVPALQTLPGYELKAVCTAHEETAKQSASLATRTSRPSVRRRSASTGFPLSQVELAPLAIPVSGSSDPGIPMPTLPVAPAFASTLLTTAATVARQPS